MNLTFDIKARRKEKKISQIDMAVKLGVVRETYCTKEKDPGKFTLNEFNQVCKILNLTIQILPDEYLNPNVKINNLKNTEPIMVANTWIERLANGK